MKTIILLAFAAFLLSRCSQEPTTMVQRVLVNSGRPEEPFAVELVTSVDHPVRLGKSVDVQGATYLVVELQ